MSQSKRTLGVGEQAYLTPGQIWVVRPGDTVRINSMFYAAAAEAGGSRAVLVERVSADKYRITLPAGFRAERYSESASHNAALQMIHEIVDEQGATHTTMPQKYIMA
jgi:hypothetical protein